jgi:hypothetical protein
MKTRCAGINICYVPVLVSPALKIALLAKVTFDSNVKFSTGQFQLLHGYSNALR